MDLPPVGGGHHGERLLRHLLLAPLLKEDEAVRGVGQHLVPVMDPVGVSRADERSDRLVSHDHRHPQRAGGLVLVGDVVSHHRVAHQHPDLIDKKLDRGPVPPPPAVEDRLVDHPEEDGKEHGPHPLPRLTAGEARDVKDGHRGAEREVDVGGPAKEGGARAAGEGDQLEVDALGRLLNLAPLLGAYFQNLVHQVSEERDRLRWLSYPLPLDPRVHLPQGQVDEGPLQGVSRVKDPQHGQAVDHKLDLVVLLREDRLQDVNGALGGAHRDRAAELPAAVVLSQPGEVDIPLGVDNDEPHPRQERAHHEEQGKKRVG